MMFCTKRLFRKLILGERGLTLIEVLISTFLMLLIISAVAGWLIHWNRTSFDHSGRIRMQMEEQTALRLIQEDVLVCREIIETGNQLVVIDTQNQMIRYYLSNNHNLIRAVGGNGATVIAANATQWQTNPVGSHGVQVTLALQQSDIRVEQQKVLASRRIENASKKENSP